jgi:hypothetical protein
MKFRVILILMRVYAFYIAILIYACFSSPTPDIFGMAEWVIAILMFIAIHPVKTFGVLTQKSLPPLLSFHRLFLLFMASVPLVVGTLNGNDAINIIRDIIPLGLLILPFAFMENDLKRLPMVLMIAGMVFALRYMIIAVPSMFEIGRAAGDDALLYLANSPLLVFACLYGFHLLTQPDKSFLTGRLIGLVVFCITCLAMAVMIQRAPLLLSLAGCAAIIFVRLGIIPLKTVIIVVCLGVLSLPLWDVAFQVISGFWDKTLTVGMNNRIHEFHAVVSNTTFFGSGWGAEWQSPAVGDYWVRYTHNMVSYYILKAGWIGGFLALGFLIIWGMESIKLARHHFAITLALLIPLTIHMSLYTGYKTFDFALLILSVFLCTRDRQASLFSTEPSRLSRGQRDALLMNSPNT